MFLDWICKEKWFLLICPLSLSTGSYFHHHFHFSPDHWSRICLHRVGWEICRTSVSPSYLSTFTFNFHFHFPLSPDHWMYLHLIAWEICRDSVSPLPYLSTFTFTRLLESSDWIYLHRVTWERFAEWVFPPSLPIFPLGINQPSGKVPTLSNQHLCELSKYFIRPFSLSSQTNFWHHLKSSIIYFRQENPQSSIEYGFCGLKSDGGKNCMQLKNELLACVGQLLVATNFC